MKRRNFLKFIGAAAATTTVSAVAVAEEKEEAPAEVVECDDCVRMQLPIGYVMVSRNKAPLIFEYGEWEALGGKHEMRDSVLYRRIK